MDALRSAQVQPIDFYGKVVDEVGSPVSGAQVVGTYGYMDGFRGREWNLRTQTDENGRFSFTGIQGDAILIDINKQGYKLGNKKRNFRYGALGRESEGILPTSTQPHIFKMWRIPIEEPTIFRYGDIDVPPGGAEVIVDLVNGNVTNESSGDLAVSSQWIRMGNGTIPSDFKVTVRAVDGGVLEGDQDYWYLAPEGGYGSHLVFEEHQGGVNYFADRRIYYRSGDGRRFSEATISYKNLDKPERTVVHLSVHVNPNGSRNLSRYEPLQINKRDERFKQVRPAPGH